ncbi:translocation/assembly module TamB domain-containing protein [Pseudooceanicola algae]|uniref:Translocation and assembly module TamB C-terminal domain-containing protein n=1 Tax=Pseudooceanicola algae TaxID=1537215 RepID=A0A418SHP5_9RHOB|nr:translocation/assembly module TamB domain-containing protein [Pseudooceanicola algae]QPM90406.1 hypothetical protein PSAL_016440 [Pseudooceanicola algae]
MLRKYLITLAALTALLLPAPVLLAQDADEDDGANFLSRTLQKVLSSAGREVRITGFEGALSTQATLGKMTIADDDGIWLELDNAVLDWRRLALLRGRLQINELTAESLTIYRLPPTVEDTSAPAPESSGFSLPDLPVSINLDQMRLDKVDLREPVFGQAAVLSLTGKAALANGGLDTDIQIDRLDRDGEISVTAAYAPDNEQITVDLTVQEPEGGILAHLMQLPGLPSVDLTVNGEGPLDNFAADLRLATDGEDRLTGKAAITGRDDGGREFNLNLGGDLTALAAPDYRDFMGTDIGLVATGSQDSDGAINLDLFRVRSAALNMEGKLALDADKQPSFFDLTGQIASPQGADRVDLPFGEGISLAGADLKLDFDRSQSDAITGRIEARAPAAQGFAADTLALDISGALPKDGAGQVGIAFDASGLSTDDPALAQAVGDAVTGSATIGFGEGPVEIRDLVFNNDVVALTGSASFETEEKKANVSVAAQADVSDLSAFSALAGLEGLAGQTAVDVTLDMTLPSGEMRLTATGSGDNLRTGIEQADALLATPVALDVDVERNETGLTVHKLDIGNEALQATAEGRLASNDGEITYALTLADAGVMTGTQSGPVTFGGAVTQTEEAMHLTGSGGGTDIAVGIEAVDNLLAGKLDLDFALNLPNEGAPDLENALIETGELRVQADGSLDPAAMALDFSARLANSGVFTGGNAGPLSLNGQVRTEAGGVIHAQLSGGGDQLGIGIEAVDNLLQGRLGLEADATVDGTLITLHRARVESPGLTLNASGTMDDGTLDFSASLGLPNSAAPLGEQAGPVDLTLKVTGSEGAYRVVADGKGQDMGIGNDLVDSLFADDSTLRADVSRAAGGGIRIDEASFTSRAITATASGVVDEEGPKMDFDARLDNMNRLSPQMNGPLTVKGAVRPDTSGAISVNVTADGPAGAQARVAGLVAKPDGSVDVTVNGSVPLGLANGFISPRSVSGTAAFDLALNGQPGLDALSGQIRLSDGRVVAPALGQVINNISGTIGLGGSRANVQMTVAPQDGGRLTIAGPVDLNAPYNANVDVTFASFIVNQGSFATTELNGTVAVRGALTGGGSVTGRIGLTNTEIRLADTGLGGPEAIPDIRHLSEPRGSYLTRDRAGLVLTETSQAGGGSGTAAPPLNLDLQIVADNAIFIRGRGLDAELRGGLTIQGTTADIRPVGQFDLVRGRLDIVAKRIDLTEGYVQLAGSFEPIIHFVAESESGDYVITISIDGSVIEPEVEFTSDPDLPEDEVLSQLFFGSGLNSLSPLQAAELASAVATLTGSGNGGLFEKLRAGTGLDELDVSTNDDGQTSLTLGKYFANGVYSETEVTGDGETSLTLNFDVSDDVTAKAEATSDGDTSLGIFFERDY